MTTERLDNDKNSSYRRGELVMTELLKKDDVRSNERMRNKMY